MGQELRWPTGATTSWSQCHRCSAGTSACQKLEATHPPRQADSHSSDRGSCSPRAPNAAWSASTATDTGCGLTQHALGQPHSEEPPHRLPTHREASPGLQKGLSVVRGHIVEANDAAAGNTSDAASAPRGKRHAPETRNILTHFLCFAQATGGLGIGKSNAAPGHPDWQRCSWPARRSTGSSPQFGALGPP